MFKRLIVLVNFNGFEKVTPKQKYALAKILNRDVYFSGAKKLKPTNKDLDCTYRDFLFNDEGESMKEFIKEIRDFENSADGVSIEIREIEELEYAKLPVNRRNFHAFTSVKSRMI